MDVQQTAERRLGESNLPSHSKRVLLKNNRMEQWDINIPVIHGDFKDNTPYPSYT